MKSREAIVGSAANLLWLDLEKRAVPNQSEDPEELEAFGEKRWNDGDALKVGHFTWTRPVGAVVHNKDL